MKSIGDIFRAVKAIILITKDVIGKSFKKIELSVRINGMTSSDEITSQIDREHLFDT